MLLRLYGNVCYDRTLTHINNIHHTIGNLFRLKSEIFLIACRKISISVKMRCRHIRMNIHNLNPVLSCFIKKAFSKACKRILSRTVSTVVGVCLLCRNGGYVYYHSTFFFHIPKQQSSNNYRRFNIHCNHLMQAVRINLLMGSEVPCTRTVYQNINALRFFLYKLNLFFNICVLKLNKA